MQLKKKVFLIIRAIRQNYNINHLKNLISKKGLSEHPSISIN
jgi:hypothetical protein